MKFLFPFVFFSAVIFSTALKSGAKSDSDITIELLDREEKANMTPKKDISNLDYIHIDASRLPSIENPSSAVKDYLDKIDALKDTKILNLSGISNTDLKLSYGPANLPFLSECDDRFADLSIALNHCALALMKEGLEEEAVQMMDYSMDLNAASREILLALGTYYKTKKPEKYNSFVIRLSSCQATGKDIILKKLQALS